MTKHTPGPLLEALIRISEWEYRRDRRWRGMVDVSEIESLKRIARAALAKISDFGTIVGGVEQYPGLLSMARFGMKCFDSHRMELGDLDGEDLQEWAESLGLLHEVHVTEPCGESCRCVEWDDFPQECLRETEEITALRAAIAKAEGR